MRTANRRHSKRLKIERSVQILVQLFPVMPFIGEAIHAGLTNISETGMALRIEEGMIKKNLPCGSKIRVHLRLPGKSLRECRGIVSHNRKAPDGTQLIGIRFVKTSSWLTKEIRQMITDNDLCDRRIREQDAPWCNIFCSFHNLCRKPLRINNELDNRHHQLEIALQAAD